MMERIESITDTGAVLLVQSIIIFACDDYKKSMKCIREMASPKAYEIVQKRAKRNMKLKRALTQEEVEAKCVQMVDEAETTIRNVKKFFRSEYFKLLCDLDGEYMINRLEEESGRRLQKIVC